MSDSCPPPRNGLEPHHNHNQAPYLVAAKPGLKFNSLIKPEPEQKRTVVQKGGNVSGLVCVCEAGSPNLSAIAKINERVASRVLHDPESNVKKWRFQTKSSSHVSSVKTMSLYQAGQLFPERRTPAPASGYFRGERSRNTYNLVSSMSFTSAGRL